MVEAETVPKASRSTTVTTRSRAPPAGEAPRAGERLIGLLGAVKRDADGREVAVLLIAEAVRRHRDRARRGLAQFAPDPVPAALSL